MKVESNTVVSLHYIMKNEAGEVMDENMEAAPVEYIQGIGKILPVLESSLVGMHAGETKSISFRNEQFNGQINIDVLIKGVRAATEEELLSGVPRKECGPDCCC